MKIFRQLLLVIIAVMFVSCQEKKNQSVDIHPLAKQTTAQTDGLRGAVRNVTEKRYMKIPDTDSIALYAIHYQIYNPEGWMMENIITDDVHDTIFSTHICYDAKGRITGRETRDSTGNISEHTVYQLDKNGFRIKESTYRKDSLISEITYKNDAVGNVLETTVQTSNLCIMKYTYGGKFFGLPTRIDRCGPDGRMFMYITMEYNDSGQMVNRRTFSANGAEAESSHSQYAENGALLKQVHEIKLQSLQKRDQCIFENHDEKGNWLKQMMLRNGNLYYVIERTIEYY